MFYVGLSQFSQAAHYVPATILLLNLKLGFVDVFCGNLNLALHGTISQGARLYLDHALVELKAHIFPLKINGQEV